MEIIVRELIVELLDCEMDSDVTIRVNLDDTYENENFSISEHLRSREVELEIDFSDKVLIDESELRELKVKIEELEEEVDG